MYQTHKYKNINTQIHKYTNTAYDEVPERPNMWYIFEKRIVQGFEKLFSQVSNAQVQNTQIQILLVQDIYIYGIYGIRCCWLIAPLTNFII